jgi:hypothetical protein
VISQYKEEVERELFPSEDNVRHMAEGELQQLVEWVRLGT